MQKSDFPMKIVLAPFEDPACGKDWDEQAPEIVQSLRADLAEQSVVRFEIKESNHGRGADWPTITLLLLAADLFFRMPECYTKIKDAFAGWRQMAADAKKIIDWLHRKYRVVGLDTETLFLLAMKHICDDLGASDDEVVVLQVKQDVPVEFRPSDDEVNHAVLFTFLGGRVLYQVVVDSAGAIAWDNQVSLEPNNWLEPTS